MIAIEIVLDARRLVAGRQVERTGMKDVPRAEAADRLSHLCGKPAARTQAPQNVLAVQRPPETRRHVARGHAQLGELAHVRTDAFDGHTQTLERIRKIGRCA